MVSVNPVAVAVPCALVIVFIFVARHCRRRHRRRRQRKLDQREEDSCCYGEEHLKRKTATTIFDGTPDRLDSKLYTIAQYPQRF